MTLAVSGWAPGSGAPASRMQVRAQVVGQGRWFWSHPLGTLLRGA